MDPRENPEKNPEFGKHSILNITYFSFKVYGPRL
jgi:hypothetical protein